MPNVIIAGGGASGALAAAQLLPRGADVTVLEPAAELARGLAYSTRCPAHLLNVPAGNMSAFPDDPEHLLRWLEAARPGAYGACSFVPRGMYGEYLQSLVNGEVRHLRTRAIGLEVSSQGVAFRTEDGANVSGDAAVIATGNAAPADWPGVAPEIAASGRFYNFAWTDGAFEVRDPDAPVLLLGSGLTAVDALLALRHNGHRGTIHMVSRRGLLPQAHVLPVCAGERYRPGASLRSLVREMRTCAAGWRAAVDAMRPDTNDCWQAFSLADQRRFLRHVRPFWDAHRHRMAPQIGAVVGEALCNGSLRLLAGRVRDFRMCGGGIAASIAMRGSADTQTLAVERVINCTGSSTDLARSTNPLLRDLLAQGWIQPDAHRLGAVTDADGRLVPCRGGPRPPIYALGPLRLGGLIESIAIPEIRLQAQELAELYSKSFSTRA